MLLSTHGLTRWQRGASVPFRSGALLGARVREDQYQGLVMIVKNFANLDSTYILPWCSAPLSFPMDRFDSALHSAVAEMSTTTPEGINAAVRRVNLSGAAGQEAADREQCSLALEESRVLHTIAALVAQFLITKRIGIQPLAGTQAVNGTFNATKIEVSGDRCGLSSAELTKRLGDLARLIFPVGLHDNKFGPGTVGPLRKLQLELKAFYTFADRFLTSDELLSHYYARAAAATKHTILRATRLLNDIDILISNLPVLLAEWQRRREQIESAVNELTWLFDGWGTVFDFAGANLFALMDDSAIVRKLTALVPNASATGPGLRTIH